jgi:hypothetical protein
LEIKKFTKVLSLQNNMVFGDATYQINKGRQTKLRKPESLPSETDVQKLKLYTVDKIKSFTDDPYTMWTSQEFIALRDLTVSRLTLFNARRGGEPARLLLTEWEDAINDAWIEPERVRKMSEIDRRLFAELKIAYQTGKGNDHLVPLLMPPETVAALKILTDNAIRDAAGVRRRNVYVFPCTQGSEDHVAGWQAVHKTCLDADIREPQRLSATKMRHRVSTLYAALDVPESERRYFYMHMGHSSNINSAIYQTPLAEAEVMKVGSKLQAMDSPGKSLLYL